MYKPTTRRHGKKLHNDLTRLVKSLLTTCGGQIDACHISGGHFGAGHIDDGLF